MDKVLVGLNVTDATAQNLLKNLAVTIAGVAAGGTGGAAAAFNADANNRMLHPNEKERLRQLAGTDPALAMRLGAAACYLVRCSAEFPAGSAAHEGMLAQETMGATFTAEIAMLRGQSDRFGAMFSYSYADGWWDKSKRVNSQ